MSEPVTPIRHRQPTDGGSLRCVLPRSPRFVGRPRQVPPAVRVPQLAPRTRP